MKLLHHFIRIQSDLINALVFKSVAYMQEIKPLVIRNKIKLIRGKSWKE